MLPIICFFKYSVRFLAPVNLVMMYVHVARQEKIFTRKVQKEGKGAEHRERVSVDLFKSDRDFFSIFSS